MGHDFNRAETDHRNRRLSANTKNQSINSGLLRKATLTVAFISIVVAACGTAAIDVRDPSAAPPAIVTDDVTISAMPRIVDAVPDQEPWGLPDYSAWQATADDEYAKPASGPR